MNNNNRTQYDSSHSFVSCYRRKLSCYRQDRELFKAYKREQIAQATTMSNDTRYIIYFFRYDRTIASGRNINMDHDKHKQ